MAPKTKQSTAKQEPQPQPQTIPVISKAESELKVEKEHIDVLSQIAKFAILGAICLLSFSIRLFAVVRYESVIHEFDPYFNFRTTKYLASEGFLDFLDWFDDRGWYPLGRTIGGTIYPGLMLTAASFYWIANAINISINIRNVCVFLAPLFSANTAIASYLLTNEVTNHSSAALLAAAFTGIVPSYISRSVGGSYDNEGVAIFALIFVFYLWIKSVHTGSMMWSAMTALAYFYMVAAWGGYVFIINLIPIYTVVMIIGGRFSNRLYIAYSTFYCLGSLLAMQVPFVSFNVIYQAECAASHGVFVLVQVIAFLGYLHQVIDAAVMQRLLHVVAFFLIGIVAFGLLAMQLMGKVQWTGRSLTLLDPTYATKYIPIIASVAEHQPTTWTSFFFDLHILVPLSPVGLFFLFKNKTDGAIFVILYGTIAWHFAGVMVRLMLTLAPIACILAAIGVSTILSHFCAVIKFQQPLTEKWTKQEQEEEENSTKKRKKKEKSLVLNPKTNLNNIPKPFSYSVVGIFTLLLWFYSYHASYVSSIAYSSPSIVIDAGRSHTGQRFLFDDYREAYFWLRMNTDVNAKIMSWWDYGYQMSAMGNKTVLVDNNTWNNTHIATVGRALATSEEHAYPILESLDVDYVLVIFGGLIGYSSDDINKFLWPVRIGSGVYGSEMPSERDYFSRNGFDIGPEATETFKSSLAYKLCYYRFGEMTTEYGKPPGFDRVRGKEVGDKNIILTTLEEAFTSEHWVVRIYKVNKQPILNSIEEMSKKTETSATQTKQMNIDSVSVKKIGCFYSESSLGSDREYVGGTTGANFNLAKYHAFTTGKRYFAVARAAGDGHAFVFNQIPTDVQSLTSGGGCERPCLDISERHCGCVDDYCSSPIPRKEEHNRRWVVYELGTN